MNAIIKIITYWKYNTWCFTDESVGLKDEAFVAGADTMITELLRRKGIPLEKANDGFILTFSAEYFPSADAFITHATEDEAKVGNWYILEGVEGQEDIIGWFCPALFRYFEVAPLKIYAEVQTL